MTKNATGDSQQTLQPTTTSTTTTRTCPTWCAAQSASLPCAGDHAGEMTLTAGTLYPPRLVTVDNGGQSPVIGVTAVRDDTDDCRPGVELVVTQFQLDDQGAITDRHAEVALTLRELHGLIGQLQGAANLLEDAGSPAILVE